MNSLPGFSFQEKASSVACQRMAGGLAPVGRSSCKEPQALQFPFQMQDDQPLRFHCQGAERTLPSISVAGLVSFLFLSLDGAELVYY